VEQEDRTRRRQRRDAERRRHAQRRRRIALIAVAGLSAVLGAMLGSRSGEDGEAPAVDVPLCDPAVAASASRLAGRMLIVRMEATATRELLARARAGEIGGVVLFPPAGTSAAAIAAEIARLRRAAGAGGSPPPLVAIDQEGGPVKRLPDLPPDRSPAALARAGGGAAALAEREGRATATALAALGVNLDLAPVLDVAIASDSFVAERTFGAQPARAAELGLAFARGLESGGVAATAKHFPGLGLATANTDLAPSTVTASREQLATGLVPFREAADAGVAAVMVSNATYPALDARAPASLSSRVIGGLLREELGYEGVVVTDDLGAGAITGSGIEEGEAAVRAARAGADLLLFAVSDGEDAHRALVRAIRRDRLDSASLEASCARTSALAERYILSR